MRLSLIYFSAAKNLIFNKKVRINHYNFNASIKDAQTFDYIKSHAAREICDRVDDLSSKEKKNILSIGSCSGLVMKSLNPIHVGLLNQTDISAGNLARCKSIIMKEPLKFPVDFSICDEEILPLRKESMDLAISCLNYHWVNDLQSSFNQVREILKDNTPFIGCLLGGDTLSELRSSLQLAEIERLSGFSCHISPKIAGQDVARLMQETGFQLITVDISQMIIRYPSIFELMFDLRDMGEDNCSVIGSNHIHRDTLKASAAIYQSLYGGDNVESGIPATFQMIHFIGWKNPASSTKINHQS